MRNLIVDERDQKFVLHEMLKVEELCQTSLYSHLDRETIDMSLDAALKLAVERFYPAMAEADREGCRLENGDVHAPQCFHQLKKHYDRGNWPSFLFPRELGGQGFPMSLWVSHHEGFMHNAPFVWCTPKPFCGSLFIERFGSSPQKEKYLKKIVSGRWGATIAANENESGCDVGIQRTVAVKQPDGSYRIKGNKSPVTSGDTDLYENIIHVVLARVEGDPANETGLSVFLVPKYLVNADGSLGPRNDYAVTGIEKKLGFNGNPACSINFGENNDCYAELIGEERQAMGYVFQLITNGYLLCAVMAEGIASAAYLHALDHARNRVQGAHISEAQNPEAQRVAIIAHPDVRRMLLWMKSQVEGMRALIYYSTILMDKADTCSDPEERQRLTGLMNLLLPICRLYSTDIGFKVTETAIQVHGRYGYFSDYPVQQFMRDIKTASIWEIANGVHALIYIAQTLGQREGRDFANLLTEMSQTTEKYKEVEGIQGLVEDVQDRVNLLGEMGLYFSNCAKDGKLLVPISNATPFTQFMGHVCLGWLHLWQAGIAAGRLEAILKENGIDSQDAAQRNEFLSRNKEAAFYDGKVHGARYFIKNVLPLADSLAGAIKNEDLSIMTVHNDGF